MIHSSDTPVHRTLTVPRPAHLATVLALPGPTLADAPRDPEAAGTCLARYCSGDHTDDSVARTEFGPRARWGARPDGAA